MLINLSNHPYSFWGEKQKAAAETYGKCIDLSFPLIDPQGDEQYIDELAGEYFREIIRYQKGSDEEIVVHLMGEMTFVFSLLEKLKNEGIRCIASTTERISRFSDEGLKETQFVFVRFRNYFIMTK